MSDIRVVTTEAVVLEEQVWFTLASLCRASGAQPQEIHALVGEGLLQPAGPGPDDWRFDGGALPRARRALRLARDLDLGPSGVALVMDLLDEIERLRAARR